MRYKSVEAVPRGRPLQLAQQMALVTRMAVRQTLAHPMVRRVKTTRNIVAAGYPKGRFADCVSEGLALRCRLKRSSSGNVALIDGWISWQAFHHFVDPALVLREMARVCRPDGAVVVVDMVSDEMPEVAQRQDELETVVDNTHTSVLSPSRLLQAAFDANLTVFAYLSRDVPMDFDKWQGHLPPDAETRAIVRRALEDELDGGRVTGMRPYRVDEKLWFTHVWGVLVAGTGHRGIY